MRRLAAPCVLTACVCLASPAFADAIEAEVARYVQVLGKSAKDDAELAARLLEAAEAQAANVKLSAALYEKVYAFGIRRPAGHAAAISAVEALMEKVPAEKSRWQEMLVNVLRARYARSPEAERDRPRLELVSLLISLGNERLRDGIHDEAVKFAQQALDLLRGRRSPLLADVQQQFRDAAAAKQTQVQLRLLTAMLTKDPASNAARTALIRLYVTELDQPKEAGKLLTEDTDQAYRTYLPLASGDASALQEGACLELARWYEGFFADVGVSAFGKGQSLRKAVDYYERYLSLHAARDPSYFAASSALAEVRKKRADLGAPPHFLKAFVLPDPSSAMRHAGTKFLNSEFTQRTLELWMRLGDGGGSIYEEGGDQRGVAMGVYQHELMFAIRTSTRKEALTVITCDSPARGRWFHLAAQFVEGKLSLWVDGQPMASGTAEKAVPEHGQGGAFGGHTDATRVAARPGKGFVGEIASVRISRAPRYSKAFLPPRVLDRDTDTMLLLDAAALAKDAFSSKVIPDLAAPEGQWELAGNASAGTAEATN